MGGGFGARVRWLRMSCKDWRLAEYRGVCTSDVCLVILYTTLEGYLHRPLAYSWHFRRIQFLCVLSFAHSATNHLYSLQSQKTLQSLPHLSYIYFTLTSHLTSLTPLITLPTLKSAAQSINQSSTKQPLKVLKISSSYDTRTRTRTTTYQTCNQSRTEILVTGSIQNRCPTQGWSMGYGL